MSLPLGSIAPDFVQDSSQGKINFHQYIQGHWAVLFSHPADFTPVCTTELGETAKLKPEFDKRNTKVLALSVDTSDSHTRWIPDINDTQKADVNFPILADADKTVATLYGMLHPQSLDNFTVRSVFIIDPNKRVRLTLTYPASTGRNFKEILRVLDSLQLTDKHKVATPVNWQDGEDVVILPSIKDPAELERLFPKGYQAVRPYLRLTPQPNR
jgi:alkyl hydroperoxide reductase subunit AhpC